MHQGNQRISPAQCGGRVRERAEGKAIDYDRRSRGCRRKPSPCRRLHLDARTRKTVAEFDNIDPPAQLPKLRDHAPVISIAAGRGREITGHREGKTLYHNGTLSTKPSKHRFTI